MTTTRPPKELGVRGVRLWRSVAGTYALADHQAELLRLACVSADRAEEARLYIVAHGAISQGKDGPRPSPAVIIERDSTLRVARLLADLDLDVGDPEPVTASQITDTERARIRRGH